MKSFAPDPRTFEGLSRERWLVVDPQSMVLDACAPGTDEKLDERARQGDSATNDVTLTIAGKPLVLTCRARAIEDGKVASGASLVPAGIRGAPQVGATR